MDDDFDFIIIVPGGESQYVTLAGPDELDMPAGRDYVSTQLCLMYANGETITN